MRGRPGPGAAFLGAGAAIASPCMNVFPNAGVAIVIGATGGIGAAMVERLGRDPAFAQVIAYGRSAANRLEILDEASIAAAAEHANAAAGGRLTLVFDATGFLSDDRQAPEKRWRDLDAAALQRSFALNAIGPALLMKHFLPLLPRTGKSVFATLSARVGSIQDNALGGWYGYRAAKAALNQLVRTAAVELARSRPDAICVALHPGTTATRLSGPFAKAGLDVRPPDVAADELFGVLQGLDATATGGFFDHHGAPIPY